MSFKTSEIPLTHQHMVRASHFPSDGLPGPTRALPVDQAAQPQRHRHIGLLNDVIVRRGVLLLRFWRTFGRLDQVP